ncbi:arylsulfatase b-like [Plakobranchus ocellatus]|uniref:Arylsulfatase b-like n=1 Tax=Plakobranchus ocellatus TaxID=259542 RepID=A0AAV4BAL8_9GAST|nr:arylsulfatase b-like [Plakobranchus ocellatus]
MAATFAFRLCLLVSSLNVIVASLPASPGASDQNEAVRSSNEKRPNIIFVLADDYGYNDVGYHGSEIATPAIDYLAKHGIILENYYVQPICTPTRSQLMSGRYQIHTGLQHQFIWNSQANGLPLDSPTIADKLKEAGYSTHMVGKWHLGFYKKQYMPQYRGFDTYFGYLGGWTNYYNHKIPFKGGGKPYLDFRDEVGPVRNESGHYSAHLFTQKAIQALQMHDQSKGPVFLYLAYQSVHSPLMVPESYMEPYKHIKNKNRRTYAGMVAALDEGVANLTRTLKQEGMWDDTIIVFSTDNGGSVPHGGNNFPLRGWKGSLWEGGMKGVGFLSGGFLTKSLRRKGQIAPGQVNRELIHVTDWFPTLVKLAGGCLNGTKPLDGVDQWQTITEGTKSKRTVLLHNIDPLYESRGSPKFNNTWNTTVRAAVRAGNFKLITGNPGNGSWVKPPRLGHVGIVADPDPSTKNVWLFDIENDPYEHNDLSEERPEMVSWLLSLLTEFNSTAVPVRFPPTHDPESNPALHGGVWGPWE